VDHVTEPGTVAVDVGDLAPGSTHWYRFTAAGTTSPIGRTRTLPDAADGRLRIVSRGDARIGTRIGGECLVALDWKGFIEVFEEPQLAVAARSITFKVVDSNIYDSKHEKHFFTGKLWDLVKKYVQPRLEAVHVDLTQPFDELKAWLPLVLPGLAAGGTLAFVNRVDGDPRLADVPQPAERVLIQAALQQPSQRWRNLGGQRLPVRFRP